MLAWIYFIGAGITWILGPIAERRRTGDPWPLCLLWLLVFPVVIMWPFFICGIVANILDGPYKPRHKADVW